MAAPIYIDKSQTTVAPQSNGAIHTVYDTDGSIRDWYTTATKPPAPSTAAAARSLSFGSPTGAPGETNTTERPNTSSSHSVPTTFSRVQTVRQPKNGSAVVSGHDGHQFINTPKEVQTPWGSSEAATGGFPPGPDDRLGSQEDVPSVPSLSMGTGPRGFSNTSGHLSISSATIRCTQSAAPTQDSAYHKGHLHRMAPHRSILWKRSQSFHSIRPIQPLPLMDAQSGIPNRDADGRWAALIASWPSSSVRRNASADCMSLPLRPPIAPQREEIEGTLATPPRNLRRGNCGLADNDTIPATTKRLKASSSHHQCSPVLSAREESHAEDLGLPCVTTTVPHSFLADTPNTATTDRTPGTGTEAPPQGGPLDPVHLVSTDPSSRSASDASTKSSAKAKEHRGFLSQRPPSRDGSHSGHRDDGSRRSNILDSPTNTSSPGLPHQGPEITLAHPNGTARTRGHDDRGTSPLPVATKFPTNEATDTGNRQHGSTSEPTQTGLQVINGSTLNSAISGGPHTQLTDNPSASSQGSNGSPDSVRLDGEMDTNPSHPRVGTLPPTGATCHKTSDTTSTILDTGHRHVRVLQHKTNPPLRVAVYRPSSDDGGCHVHTVETSDRDSPLVHAPARNFVASGDRTSPNRANTSHTDHILTVPLYEMGAPYWIDLAPMIQTAVVIPHQLQNYVVPDGTQPRLEKGTRLSTLAMLDLCPTSSNMTEYERHNNWQSTYSAITPRVVQVQIGKTKPDGPLLQPTVTELDLIKQSLGPHYDLVLQHN